MGALHVALIVCEKGEMVKFIKYTVLILLLAALVAAGIVAYMLKTYQVSNEQVTQMLAEALSAPDGSVRASIEEASLNWQDWQKLGTINASRVVLRDSKGEIFASFPKVRLRLNPLAFVLGGQKFSEIAMLRPQFYVQRDDAGNWRLGLGEANKALGIQEMLAGFGAAAGDGRISGFPFKRVVVRGAQVYLDNKRDGSLLSSTRANIIAQIADGAVEVQMNVPVMYNEQTSQIFAGLVISDSGHEMVGEWRVQHFPLPLLCEFVACPENTAFEGDFTGRILPNLRDDMLHTVIVQGTIADAKLTKEDVFAEPLHLKQIQVDAAYNAREKVLQLRRIDMRNDALHATLNGDIQKIENDYSADISGHLLAPFDGDKLYKYWPIVAAPETRLWVKDNIKNADVPEANVEIRIRPGDLAAEILPDSVLKSTIMVRGVNVKFLPDFPTIKQADGTVYFTGRTMRVEADSGKYLKNSTLKNAWLQIDDLFHPNVPMHAQMAFDASAADVAALFALKHFAFDDDLKLDPASLSGRVDGELSLKFDAFSEANTGLDLDKVMYDLDATIKGISQKQFMQRFDVSGFSGNLKTSPGNVNFKGDGLVDGRRLNLALKQRDAGAFHALINGTLPVAVLEEMAGRKLPWLEAGGVGVNVDVEYGKNLVRIHKLAADLSGTQVNIPELNFTKLAGLAGSAKLSKMQNDPNPNAFTFNADIGALEASGNLVLDSEGDVQALTLAKLTTPENNLRAAYRRLDNGARVDVSGEMLNAIAAYAGTENSLLANFPSIHLLLNLKKLLLVEEHPITLVQGELNCLGGKCTAANLSGVVGKGNVALDIHRENGERKFAIHSGNAGDLLKALDITDRVFNGKLSVKGHYDDTAPNTPLKTRAIIQDFTLKNSQILARLFSVGSLTGLANLLTGSGIAVDKFAVDIAVEKGVFTLAKGKAQGNAMGFTTEGTVDTNTTELNLKGVLVPAFFLNSLVGNIPIIGELAGGEGEGLIAFNYSITGKYSDPKTFVNPLSGLTPGFLRGIFNVFDAPTKTTNPDKEGAEGEKPSTEIQPQQPVKN